MSFANHNILDIALSLIPPTLVQIRKNLGTQVNKFGQSEAAYSDWIEVYGIVQPGSEHNEHTERVDFSKKYVTIWLRGVALDGTHIQWAPDQIRYVGRIFNVTSVEDWFPYDNYRKCECVEALNLGESQRSGTANEQTMRQAQQKLARRRKVIPKNPNGESVDNLKLAAMPQEQYDALVTKPQSQAVQAPENPIQEAPPPPSKKASLVGKARIRF